MAKLSNEQTSVLLSELLRLWEHHFEQIRSVNQSAKFPKGFADSVNDFEELCRHLAKQVRTPPDVLTLLSTSSDLEVLRAVVVNPSTPRDVVKRLLGGDKGLLKHNLAANANTPKPILWFLAEEGDSDVRATLAASATTPAELLVYLAETDDEGAGETEWNLMHNPNTPIEALELIAERADDLGFKRVALAQLNVRSVTAEVLHEMNHDTCTRCGTEVFVEAFECPTCGLGRE